MPDSAVTVVRAGSLTPAEPSVGVVRSAAVVLAGLWSGQARTEPGVTSGWHHHGDHDTIVYVVRGAFRVETATATLEAGPGDFVHVPAQTVHRESNPSPEVAEVILVRRGDGPLVVNVDAPVP